MKYVAETVSLVFAIAAITGCGTDPGAITDAARDQAAQATAAALRLKEGEVFAYKTSDIETVIPVRIEVDGSFAEQDGLFVRTAEHVAVRKVMGRTRVANAGVDGFAIHEVSQKTVDTEKVDNVTEDYGASAPEPSAFVLFDLDGWVRRIESGSATDEDDTMGEAEYPLRPRAGFYYVDDRGQTYQATEEKLTVAGIAGMKLVARRAAPVLSLEEFFETCYVVQPAESGIPDYVDIMFNPAAQCFGPNGFVRKTGAPAPLFLLSGEASLIVGDQLALQRSAESVSVGVDRIHCGPGQFVSPGAEMVDCDKKLNEIYLEGYRITKTVQTQLVKREVSADPAALPRIEDAD